jgi:hypothetical protein
MGRGLSTLDWSVGEVIVLVEDVLTAPMTAGNSTMCPTSATRAVDGPDASTAQLPAERAD